MCNLKLPDKVIEHVRLIDDFLARSEAIVPVPNPEYVPVRYRNHADNS